MGGRFSDTLRALALAAVRRSLEWGEPLTLQNLTKGRTLTLRYHLSERQGWILLVGGLISYLKAWQGRGCAPTFPRGWRETSLNV